MNGKVIQIAAVLTPAGVALYALTDTGKIYEKLVGRQNANWVEISTTNPFSLFQNPLQ